LTGRCGPVHAPHPEAVAVELVVVDEFLDDRAGVADEVPGLAVEVGWDVEAVDLGLEFAEAVYAELAVALEVFEVLSGCENGFEVLREVGDFDGGTDSEGSGGKMLAGG